MRALLLLLAILSIPPLTLGLVAYSEPFEAHATNYVEGCGDVDVSCGSVIDQAEVSLSCSMYAINASGCQSITISDSDTQKSFKVLDFTTPLLSTTSKNEAVAKAQHIYALSTLNTSFQNQLVWLKENRNEDLKCWPQENCLLSTTTEVMMWLSRAGLNRTSRVYDDGLKYTEALQNKFSNEDWEIDIRTDENTRCDIRIEDNEIFDGDVEDGSASFDIEYQANRALNVTCEQDFTIIVTDSFGNVKQFDRQEGNDNSYYLFPGGCWPRDNTERICSVETTAKALDLMYLDEEVFDDGEEWVEDQIRRGFITGERLEDEEDVIAHARLHAATGNEDIRDWLLFHQRNDGSFQDEDKFLATLEVLRSVTEDSEWIDDAEDWLNTNRPPEGFGNNALNSLSYNYQKEETIRTTPSILTSSEPSLDFTVYSDEANAKVEGLSHELTLSQTYPREGTLTFQNITTGWQRGNLTLSLPGLERKVQIIVTEEANIGLDIADTVYTEEPQGFISASITTPKNTTCMLSSTSLFENRTVSSDGQISLSYDLKRGTHNDTVSLECPTALGNRTVTEAISITHYPYPPFSTKLSDSQVESVETLTVKNNLPKEIGAGLSFDSTSPFYSLPSSLSIPEGAEAEVKLYQLVESPQNITENNTITVNALGYSVERDISFLLDTTVETVGEDVEVRSSSEWPWLAILILLGIVVTGFGGYLYMQQEGDEATEEDTEQAEDALKTVVGEIELALDMQEGKTDAKDLREQGYSENDIEDIESMLRKILPNEKE